MSIYNNSCIMCGGRLDKDVCLDPNCLAKGIKQDYSGKTNAKKCPNCLGAGQSYATLPGPASGLHQSMLDMETCRDCNGTGIIDDDGKDDGNQEATVTELPCYNCGEMNDIGAKSCWSFHCGVESPNRRVDAHSLNRRKSKMNDIDQLIRLADLFDSSGEYEAASKIDALIEKTSKKVAKTTTLADVFEKLAKVADSLDSEGAIKEASMIDSFISKHAGSNNYDDEQSDEDLEELYEEHMSRLDSDDAEPDIHGKHFDIDDVDGGGLNPDVSDEVIRIREELELLDGKRAALISRLNKSADYNEFRQGEGDTEQSKRYDDRHHHNLQVREPKRDQERVDREGRKEHHVDTYKPHEGMLSSRYCPDHISSQLGRVGQGVYQCPLDGAIYNWELGYTNFDGVKVPGGSIAAQTPDSSGYGAAHRIFDSRSRV